MKPREFKLIVEPWRTNALPWGDELNDLTTGEEIHVIEFEAYEALQNVNEAINRANEKASYENYALAEQNKILREALEMIKRNSTNSNLKDLIDIAFNECGITEPTTKDGE